MVYAAQLAPGNVHSTATHMQKVEAELIDCGPEGTANLATTVHRGGPQ